MAGGSSIARFGFDTSCVVTSIDQVEDFNTNSAFYPKLLGI
jgi:hypothetical protein